MKVEFVLREKRRCQYKGLHVGSRRADFIVEKVISVELKALTITEQVHISQAKSYLKAYHVETGLLINFGTPSLEFKRLFNEKFQ
jgi:GxxExxY protein